MRGACGRASLVLLFTANVFALDLSSSTIVSPYQLLGSTIPSRPGFKSLPVFPESLSFDMSWGFLSVGRATLSAERLVDFGGRPAYHIVSEAVSNAFCDTFYQVRDLNESWLDAERLSSLGYSKKLREGRFFRDEWVLYDKGRFLARTTDRDGAFKVEVGTNPVTVQDILSSIYFIRTQDLAPGKEIVVDVNTKQNWPLVIKVVKRERIKTAAGSFDTVLVEPSLRQEGLFIQKGKRLRIWLTDDARRMLVMMKVEVFFGHVTASLAK